MRKFAFAILAIFFVNGAYAQDQDSLATQDQVKKEKRVSWGVKANVNFASERNAPESKFRNGFAAGFFMEVKINERFSIQPELMYSQQGSRQYLVKGSLTSGDNILQYDYINLPLLLKIYVYLDRLSVEVGPQFGYMVSHHEKRTPRTQTDRREKIESDWMNKFDVAAALGVTYKFYGPFEAYARYNYGFMKIYNKDNLLKANNLQFSYFADNKNSVLQVGIAARF